MPIQSTDIQSSPVQASPSQSKPVQASPSHAKPIEPSKLAPIPISQPTPLKRNLNPKPKPNRKPNPTVPLPPNSHKQLAYHLTSLSNSSQPFSATPHQSFSKTLTATQDARPDQPHPQAYQSQIIDHKRTYRLLHSTPTKPSTLSLSNYIQSNLIPNLIPVPSPPDNLKQLALHPKVFRTIFKPS